MIISKAYIAMMDILANNNWERPIYYVATTGSESFFGLDKYFQMEGLAYRLVPVRDDDPNTLGGLYGRVNPDVLYENVKKFDFSEYANPDVYFSEDYTRTVINLKMFMLRLADAFVAKQRPKEAYEVLNLCYSWFPQNTIPYDNMELYLGELYFKCGLPEATKEGLKLFNDYVGQMELENRYYAKFKGNKMEIVRDDWERNRAICNQIVQIAGMYRQAEVKGRQPSSCSAASLRCLHRIPRTSPSASTGCPHSAAGSPSCSFSGAFHSLPNVLPKSRARRWALRSSSPSSAAH